MDFKYSENKLTMLFFVLFIKTGECYEYES